MKIKPTAFLAAIPILAVGYVAYHPGVAHAETSLASTTAQAELQKDGTFVIDPAHTSVGFDVGHLGLARVQGRFNKLSGKLVVDSKDLSKSNVSVTIETASIDTNVAPRDTHLRSADFFEVEKHPEINFVSNSIQKRGNNYVANGNLTMKGVTKPVSITFKAYGPIKDPWGGTRIGIIADPLKLKRTDYGIDYSTAAVSDDVVVRFSLEATLEKSQ